MPLTTVAGGKRSATLSQGLGWTCFMPREISCFSLLMLRTCTSIWSPLDTSSLGWLMRLVQLISEMSWTKRINHPSELVSSGDQIEVQVLNINKEKQEISLGMKQVQPNPWDKVAERFPPATVVNGIVRNLTNYGAFIEVEEGIDGLLHVSDMSWVRKVSNPNEVVKKGDKVTCVVLNVDQERKRVALGLKQMANEPWEGDIPSKYRPGMVCKGKVTKITNFGVFVELEPGLEGLLHISELSDHKVDNPEEVVKVGQKVEVRIIKIDPDERKIGLTLIQAHFEGEEAAGEKAPKEAAAERPAPQ